MTFDVRISPKFIIAIVLAFLLMPVVMAQATDLVLTIQPTTASPNSSARVDIDLNAQTAPGSIQLQILYDPRQTLRTGRGTERHR